LEIWMYWLNVDAEVRSRNCEMRTPDGEVAEAVPAAARRPMSASRGVRRLRHTRVPLHEVGGARTAPPHVWRGVAVL
jgi:hypothetical protein